MSGKTVNIMVVLAKKNNGDNEQESAASEAYYAAAVPMSTDKFKVHRKTAVPFPFELETRLSSHP